MSDLIKQSRILDLFGDERNSDVFRLAIRGFTVIEDTLDEGLKEAFGGEIPHDLRQISWRARVALAVALGAVPEDFRGALGKLHQVRNQLAHGELVELTESHAREIYAVVRQIAPGIDEQAPSMKTELQAEIQLGNLLLLTEIGMRASFEDAQERREAQTLALSLWSGHALADAVMTADDIREQVADEQFEDERLGD